MLSTSPFYHKSFKRAIIAFGSLFSNIYVERQNADASVSQTIKVPIAQSPKEKWIVRIDSDPTLENHTYTTLPRMAFEITNIGYDSTRKVNKLNRIACAKSADSMASTYAPVPYNIDITLYVLTKTQEDAFQIAEQILPYFTPEFTLGVKSLDQMNVITDIPIILNSVTQQDDYDGDFQTRRFITWTFNFTLKLNLFGPVHENGVITKVIVDIGEQYNKIIDPDQEVVYTATIDPESKIIAETLQNTLEGYRDPISPAPGSNDNKSSIFTNDTITIEKF